MTPERVAELFRIGGETVADPERRAALWRDLAAGLERDHGGEAEALLAASAGRLGGAGGLLGLLARYEAYADPLAKKSFLFAKICDRRGWLERPRPRELGGVRRQRPDAARAALRARPPRRGRRGARGHARRVRAGGRRPPRSRRPLLDDLLWELGRGDPDLLGTDGGDLQEPPRDPASAWY